MEKNNRMGKGKMKILQIIPGGVSFGGIESFICNNQQFLDTGDMKNAVLSVLKLPSTGVVYDFFSEVYSINHESVDGIIKDKFRLFLELKAFFQRRHFDIVHVHGGLLYAFLLCFILPRDTSMIVHIHAQYIENNLINRLLLCIMRKTVLKHSDYVLGCSREALDTWLGQSSINNPKCKIITNAIDTEKYSYNPFLRKKKRKTNRLVFGYVSRISEGKNHYFLLDIFKEIHEKKYGTELWLVGDGEKEKELKLYVEKLQLEDFVFFLGGRSDIPELLQAMDAFIFPSRQEGFGMVAIEAQAAGLPIYASDNVPPEVAITNLVHFLPLSIGKHAWANYILNDIQHLPSRISRADEIREAGYDIKETAEVLRTIYINALQKRGLR